MSGHGKNEELIEQQLWDLAYGLLSDEEAAALHARITSEPTVARAYAKMRLQADLVAQAARLEQPSIALHLPHEVPPAAAVTAPPRNRGRRPVWYAGMLSAAALLLVAVAGVAVWQQQPSIQPTTQVAMTPPPVSVRTVLTTPVHFEREIDNPVLVQTRNEAGRPVAAEVELRLYDEDGVLQWRRRERTDAEGESRWQLAGKDLPARARVEVVPAGASSASSTATAHVDVRDTPYVNHLVTDRPVYRPGDALFFRSVVLSRFDLQAGQDLPMTFSVTRGDGQPVAELQASETTRQGVAAGHFALPATLPGGSYELVASNGQLSPERRVRFLVRRYELPRWKKTLELARDSYSPGDEVVAELTIEQADGSPAAGVQLEAQAFASGAAVPVEPAQVESGQEGKASLAVRLPEAMEAGEALLAVTVQQGNRREVISKQIPVNLGQVQVDFFPEGGDLIAGVPSRVYFRASTPAGEPVHLTGRVLDNQGRVVANVHTRHQGRGSFVLQPQADADYALQIDQPAVSQRPELPAARIDPGVVLHSAPGVFAAGQPVQIELRAAQPTGPIVLAAYCRGGLVGLARVEAHEFERRAAGHVSVKRSLPVAGDAAGVIRITAFEYGQASPRPLAERLVFRHPQRRLHVEANLPSEPVTAGEAWSMELQTRSENGAAVPATLGISVVSERALAMAELPTATLPTYFYLASEIREPRQLEEANFFVQPTPEAAEALDLLLGTQGWRRFVGADLAQLAMGGFGGARGMAAPASQALSTAPGPAATPPQVTDVTAHVAPAPPTAGAQFRPNPPRRAAPAVEAALPWLLVLLVVALLLLAISQRQAIRYWAPPLALGLVGVLLALVLWSPPWQWGGREGSIAMQTEKAAVESADEGAPTSSEAPAAADAAADYSSEGLDSRSAGAAASSAATNLGAYGMPPEEEKTSPVERIESAPPPAELRDFKAARRTGDLSEAASRRNAMQPAAPPVVPQSQPQAGPSAENASSELLYEQFGDRLRRQYAQFFAMPEGASQQTSSDTLYWEPRLQSDPSGRVIVQVPGSADAYGAYRVRIEGHAEGRLGAFEARVVLQAP